MLPQIEIQLIAMLSAAACAIPGVFLVLRRMSMMSDSITHTILLGIVLSFFLTKDLSSPILIFGAGIMGIITVWLTETLTRTRLLSEDSSIGIVFPLLFSIAVILISRYAGSVHLDTDSVLLGELAFAPFSRLRIWNIDLGAKAIYTSGALLLINTAAVSLFYKEFQLSAFDSALAASLGFSPILLHYGLTAMVSFTTVVSFEAVGSILVVAFMIGLPASAYLLTDNLKRMLWLSVLFGAITGIIGFPLALWLDVSIAGCMASVVGIIFTLSFLLSPSRGLLHNLTKQRRKKRDFGAYALLFYLFLCEQQGGNDYSGETVENTQKHLKWEKNFFTRVVKKLRCDGLLTEKEEKLTLTDKGKVMTRKARVELFCP